MISRRSTNAAESVLRVGFEAAGIPETNMTTMQTIAAGVAPPITLQGEQLRSAMSKTIALVVGLPDHCLPIDRSQIEIGTMILTAPQRADGIQIAGT